MNATEVETIGKQDENRERIENRRELKGAQLFLGLKITSSHASFDQELFRDDDSKLTG